MRAMDADTAYAYARRLRGDPASVNPPDWHVEWDDAPWPFKVYDGGSRLRLGGADPAWLPTGDAGPLDRIGRVLFDAAGCTRVRWRPGGAVLGSPEHPGFGAPGAQLSLRRAVPSGGAMYPTEVYVLSLVEHPGLYHYDPARHELTDLAHPEPAAAARAILGLAGHAEPAPVLMLLTDCFWKNFYKYGDFAYRLGAVDLGVVAGRLLRCGLAQFGSAQLVVDFDDDSAYQALGVDDADEGIYAIVGLGRPCPPRTPVRAAAANGRAMAPAPPPLRQRSRRVRRSDDLIAMHAAASAGRAPGRPAGYPAPPAANGSAPASGGSVLPAPAVPARPPAVRLPAPAPALLAERAALHRRSSNGTQFTGAPIGPDVLAAVLAAGAASAAAAPVPVVLYCAAERVTGVAAGWYRYSASRNELIEAGAGSLASPAPVLREALHIGSINVELAAFTVHVATPLDFRAGGAREYRIQQLAAGMVIDAVAVAATAAGVGAHPLLGVNAGLLDRMYGLDRTGELGVQAQVSVGAVRPGLAMEGSVAG